MPGTRGRCTCAHEILPPPRAVQQRHERPERPEGEEEDDEEPWSSEEEAVDPADGFPWWANMAERGGGCDAEAVVASLDALQGCGAQGPTAEDLGLGDEHEWGED